MIYDDLCDDLTITIMNCRKHSSSSDAEFKRLFDNRRSDIEDSVRGNIKNILINTCISDIDFKINAKLALHSLLYHRDSQYMFFNDVVKDLDNIYERVHPSVLKQFDAIKLNEIPVEILESPLQENVQDRLNRRRRAAAAKSFEVGLRETLDAAFPLNDSSNDKPRSQYAANIERFDVTAYAEGVNFAANAVRKSQLTR